jgi:hypothetical protein
MLVGCRRTVERKKLTLLHLGDQLLVEETTGLLVQRAVDGDDIALSKHLLEALNATAANLLLNLRSQRLVVEVEELLAIEGLETAEHTLTDTADGNGTDDLVLEVVLVLGDGSDVPVTSLDLLMGGDEVADEGQNGHDDMLGDGNDVGAGDFGNGDTAVGLVGGVQVDVVRANTGRDGDLEVLGLREALGGEVTGVETGEISVRRGEREYRAGTTKTHGVVMMTSASTSSWSNLEFSPSLSEVVTRV